MYFFLKPILILLIFLYVSGCQGSEYRDTLASQNFLKSLNQVPAKPGENDGTNTGLDACVAEAFDEQNIAKYTAPELPESFDNISDVDLSDRDTWLDYYELLMLEVVDPATGFIDYNALRTEKKSLWDQLYTGLTNMDLPSPSGPKDAVFLSMWTNVYNAVMIQQVLENTWNTVPSSIFGKKVFTPKGGKALSLNAIEYGHLAMNQGSSTPEPRLHVALVCGAASCPKLRPLAYRSESLDTQLNENMHMFANSSFHFAINDNGVGVSRLLDWFKGDFVVIGNGSLAGLSNFHLSECRDADEQQTVAQALSDKTYYVQKYNWAVNSL